MEGNGALCEASIPIPAVPAGPLLSLLAAQSFSAPESSFAPVQCHVCQHSHSRWSVTGIDWGVADDGWLF